MQKTATPTGFAPLEGRAAVRYLIGKTIVAPVDAFKLKSAKYIIDDTTVLQGDIEIDRPLVGGIKTGRTCFISPWKFTDTDDCGDQSRLVTTRWRCEPFRMLIAKPPTGRAKNAGALRGYYWLDYLAGKSKSPFSKAEAEKIVDGNVTGCPLAAPPTSVAAIELAETDRSVALDAPTPWTDGKVSPAAIVHRFLVGNSIVWPNSDEEPCGMTTYFSADGFVYSLKCDSNLQRPRSNLQRPRFSDHPVFDVVTTRWKMVHGRFCLENVEAESVFDQCDPYLLSAFLAASETRGAMMKRLHAYFIFGASDVEPNGHHPGLVVHGNPAGFKSTASGP